jgi:ABC-type Mn2+/Zn2+ transport system permease subunit/Mn-dependent DtxR family transcriptional regulator
MIEVLAQVELDWSQWLAPFGERWWQETLCSALVGVACGVLGCFVVLRRMALIGDALSHAVLPGVVIAFMITRTAGVIGLLTGALLAGLATAVLINLVSRFSRTKEDSSIGIVFTAFFALGIVLISALPRGLHFDLKCFLFGDPLAVGPADLWMMAIIAPAVVMIVVLLYHPLKLSSFDPVVAAAMGLPVVLLHYLLMGMLSATVVAGLKTTGVILVVAMVITPASAAYQLTNRFWLMLSLAGLFGALSAAIGMSVAFITNAPTGPAMVIVAAVLFALAVLLSPSHGVVFDRIRRYRLSKHIQGEDVLKALYRLAESGQTCTVQAVAQDASMSTPLVSRLLETLRTQGLVAAEPTPLSLTQPGEARAVQMIRSHRLWESYLVDQAQQDVQVVHDQAERLEHAHGLADEVDQKLGYPRYDPQGKLIPRPENQDGE